MEFSGNPVKGDNAHGHLKIMDMDSSGVWELLQNIQHELRLGSLETQDEAITELQNYLEEFSSIIFPSFIYPLLESVFSYHSTNILPSLLLSDEDRQVVQEGFERTLCRLKAQEEISKDLEAKLKRMFNQAKAKELRSVKEVVIALSEKVGAQGLAPLLEMDVPVEIQQDRELGRQYRALKKSLFTSKRVLPFFKTLISRMLPEQLKVEFEQIQDLFWNELNDLLQMKVVLIRTQTKEPLITRLDIETSVESVGCSNDRIEFENEVDDRMYQSCRKAVGLARAFLEQYFPEEIRNKFIQVRCRFLNPIMEYQDTSVSLAVGLKVVGDILDLEINPHLIVSGEVDDSGRIISVRHLPEKVRAADQHPDIYQIYLPEDGSYIGGNRTPIVRVSTFTEVVQQYYGPQLQQRRNVRCEMNRLRREDWSEAFSTGAFYGRKKELAQLKRWLVKDRCRLVMLLGMGGMGKSSLAAKLGEQIKSQFNYCYWRDLKNAPLAEDLLRDCILFLSDQQRTDLPEGVDSRITLFWNIYETIVVC